MSWRGPFVVDQSSSTYFPHIYSSITKSSTLLPHQNPIDVLVCRHNLSKVPYGANAALIPYRPFFHNPASPSVRGRVFDPPPWPRRQRHRVQHGFQASLFRPVREALYRLLLLKLTGSRSRHCPNARRSSYSIVTCIVIKPFQLIHTFSLLGSFFRSGLSIFCCPTSIKLATHIHADRSSRKIAYRIGVMHLTINYNSWLLF